MVTLIFSFLVGLLLGRLVTRQRKKKIYAEAYEAGRQEVLLNKKKLIRTAYSIGLARGKDAPCSIPE